MSRKNKKIQGTVRIGKRTHGVIFLFRRSVVSGVFLGLAIVCLVVALTMAGIPVGAMVWYRVFPRTSDVLARVLRRPVVGFEEVVHSVPVEPWQPEVDESLPEGNWVRIESIGLETQIVEKEYASYEEALQQGVWRVPDMGTAYERRLPMILVAHRFGYLAWSNAYRRQNSFFNLPKLENGDQVEVIWGQRKYTYEIYDGEEAPQVTNYTADLILYTCKFLESDVRIFRYGRLIAL
jgi:sortase (surface protein transpeptidase)